MIDGFARLEIAGADAAAYATLLGDGLRAGGVTVLAADRTRIVLAAADLERASATLRRRAVEVDDDDSIVLNGLEIGLVASVGGPARGARSSVDDVRLDHVVVHTSSAERAVANYAGRLGLDLRLERHAPQWKAHMLFLRCGDAVLEVIEPLDPPRADAADAIWGVAWRVPSLGATAERLADGGVAVSETRRGRKPGTRVCTVKDSRFGVPTLLIEHEDNEVTVR